MHNQFGIDLVLFSMDFSHPCRKRFMMCGYCMVQLSQANWAWLEGKLDDTAHRSCDKPFHQLHTPGRERERERERERAQSRDD